MAIHHVVLSLLGRGESYGYELKGAFEREVGPQWGELNIGHLYQVLERLRRDGLIGVVRSETQPRGSDRVIYAITAGGRAELRRWLDEPSPRGVGYRDELYLKLVAAARAGAPVLRAVARREREAALVELHDLRSIAAEQDAPLVALLVEGAALQAQARLRLLDRVDEDVDVLAQAARGRGGAVRDQHRSRRAAG